MMIIGFTGTREGMTALQKQSLTALIDTLKPKEVHHGDCVGADAEFHDIVQGRRIRTIIHPPDNDGLRAHCQSLFGFTVTPRLYLQRNIDIIEASDLVIAAPKGPELQRSGTWMTIRRAHTYRRPVIIIYPEGNIERKVP